MRIATVCVVAKVVATVAATGGRVRTTRPRMCSIDSGQCERFERTPTSRAGWNDGT